MFSLVLLFSFARSPSFNSLRVEYFKLASSLINCMHEQKSEAKKKISAKRNETNKERERGRGRWWRLFNASFRLCKHLPRGLVYIYMRIRWQSPHFDVLLLSRSPSRYPVHLIRIAFIFFVTREHRSSPPQLLINSIKMNKYERWRTGRAARCDDTFLLHFARCDRFFSS